MRPYPKKLHIQKGKIYKLIIVLGIWKAFLNPIYSETPHSGSIEWRAVPSASGYQIQIKDPNGKKIIDKQLLTNSYSIQELPMDKYQVRVGVLSPFGSVVQWSKWNSVEVRNLLQVASKEKSLPALGVSSIQKLPPQDKDTNSKTSQNAIGSIQENTQFKIKNDFLKNLSENITTLDNSSSSDPSRENALTEPKTSQEEEKNWKVNCNHSQLPKEVIKDCKDDYIVLDLGSKEKRSIYNNFILNTNNRSARIQVARFYQDQCKLADNRILSKIREILDSSNPKFNFQEQREYKKTLESIRDCK